MNCEAQPYAPPVGDSSPGVREFDGPQTFELVSTVTIGGLEINGI
jgi:hypothetical protein